MSSVPPLPVRQQAPQVRQSNSEGLREGVDIRTQKGQSLGRSMKRIEFHFDIGSPYSYLAATQMRGLAERTGAEVQWSPFLLGAVFKALDSHSPVEIAPKGIHMYVDLQRWAKRYGVTLNIPSRFPTNTLQTQRALVAAERLGHVDRMPDFALTLFTAYWVEDRPVSDAAEIERIATGIGLDGAAIVAATSEQETKDRLRELTEGAIRRGAFGAPTFFVDDQMFWGNDRVDFLEEYLRG